MRDRSLLFARGIASFESKIRRIGEKNPRYVGIPFVLG